MRKCCKECPHRVNSQHNTKFKTWVNNLTEQGIIKEGKHRCHMIDAKNLWVEPTEENVCIGSIEN